MTDFPVTDSRRALPMCPPTNRTHQGGAGSKRAVRKRRMSADVGRPPAAAAAAALRAGAATAFATVAGHGRRARTRSAAPSRPIYDAATVHVLTLL